MQLANWITVFSFIGAAVLPYRLAAQTTPPRQALARVGDQAIYEEDLLPAVGPQLFQLKNQEYELKNKALENVINQRLLEAEAKNKGLTTEAFLEQTVDRTLPA